jgi:hypothetical protein
MVGALLHAMASVTQCNRRLVIDAALDEIVCFSRAQADGGKWVAPVPLWDQDHLHDGEMLAASG